VNENKFDTIFFLNELKVNIKSIIAGCNDKSCAKKHYFNF